MLDPDDMVACLGRRRRALRRAARGAFDRDSGRLVGLVRAPLQRRPGQRLRQPAQPHTEHGRPLSRWRARRPAPAGDDWPARGHGTWPAYAAAYRRLPAARGAGRAVGLRRRGEPLRRPRTAVDAGQAGDARATRRRPSGCAACSATCSRPAAWSPLAAAPFMPVAARRVCPAGSRLPLCRRWQRGTAARRAGGVGRGPWRRTAGQPEILFPRVESQKRLR